MSYKIAVATSDGIKIDKSFGSADSFSIYEVDGERCQKTEVRICTKSEEIHKTDCSMNKVHTVNGCNSGGCGNGCGGQNGSSENVELIADCRCAVCLKIGFHIQKQLERKAISAFDVNCTVAEALKKITAYYKRVDNHMSLRK